MKNLFLLLFVILSIPVAAQDIFSPGYIVTAEGDTLRGFILEKSDAEMSRQILFKTDKDKDVQKFDFKTIAGFGFESGREFERKILFPKPGKNEDTTYIFAKNILHGQTDVFVGRGFRKGHPNIFLDNNLNNTSIQVYKSRNEGAVGLEEFFDLFYNNPDSLVNPQGVRFPKKKLLRSITMKNEMASGNFPVSIYREKIEHSWDFLAGMPVDYRNEAYHFRGAIYLNRTRPERTSKLSFLHGLIYHHWEKKDISIPGTQQYGVMNTKWQMINLMPIGIKVQGNSENFKPYGYIGAGLALLRETDRSLEDIGNTEDQISYRFQPTINSGVGVKIKLGKHFLLTELTPTVSNVFFNLGLSI